MQSLSPEEKNIVLNFYFRCGDDDEIDRGRDLIASDPRAAELYSSLESSLQQLDSIKYEPCPENLAELTVARLKAAADAVSSEPVQLTELLRAEQAKKSEQDKVTTRQSFWRVIEFGAVAAAVLILASLYKPTFSRMREMSWQTKCNANLARVGAAFDRYGNDHNGDLPHVASAAGAPWWKVGNQGIENHSNSRHLWLLVKDGYAEGADFVCPGRKDAKAAVLSDAMLEKHYDFPNRNSLSYSFKYMCDKASHERACSKMVLLGDLNPVFEEVFDRAGDVRPGDFATVRLNERLKKMMSSNHNYRGQNILFGDESVSFNKSRIVFGDDIYTVHGMDVYFGCEAPCDEWDTFLAP